MAATFPAFHPISTAKTVRPLPSPDLHLTTSSSNAHRRVVNRTSRPPSACEHIRAVERCPYPVVVAVHGIAPGLDIDIVSARDVRYAASTAVPGLRCSLRLVSRCATDP